MSFVRSTAQKISAMVVRCSSAGCKEWAEGLEREADFIENDWKALTWSLGSLRVLLDRRPAPIRTYADLVPIVEKFVGQMQIYSWYWIVTLMQSCLALHKVFRPGAVSQHAGNTLMSAGWLLITIQSFQMMRKRRYALRSNDPMDVIRYYKRELQEGMHFCRSRRGLASMLVLLLFIPGIGMTNPNDLTRGFGLPLLVSAALLVLFVLHTRRNARRRLQEIDALLETESGAR